MKTRMAQVVEAVSVLTVFYNYKISRENFEPEPGFEPWTSGFLARRSNTSSNLSLPGSGSKFSLEIL